MATPDELKRKRSFPMQTGSASPASIGPSSDHDEIDDVFARAKLTKEFLADMPRLGAKTAINMAIAASNWIDRVNYTYLAALEEPGVSKAIPYTLLAKPDAMFISAWKKHWDTPEARNGRYHNLHLFEPVGRAMYTAVKLGDRLFKHPVATAAELVIEDELGRKFGVKSRTMMERVRQVYNHPDAKEWIKKNGEVLIDLPLQVVSSFSDPTFHALAGARFMFHEKSIGAISNALRKLPKNASDGQLLDLLETAFESPFGIRTQGKIADDLLSAIKNNLDTRGAEDTARMLHAVGMRPPSILSEISPKWLKPAGSSGSAVESAILAKNADRMADVRKRWASSDEDLEKFVPALQELDRKELLQLAMALRSYDSVRHYDDAIRSGRAMSVSPKVREAFTRWRELAKKDITLRREAWDERLMIRLDEADGLLARYRDSLRERLKVTDYAGVLNPRDKTTLKNLEGVKAEDLTTLAEVTVQNFPEPRHLQEWYGAASDLRKHTSALYEAIEDAPRGETVSAILDFAKTPEGKRMQDLGVDLKVLAGELEARLGKEMKSLNLGRTAELPNEAKLARSYIHGFSRPMRDWYRSMEDRVKELNRLARDSPNVKEFQSSVREFLRTSLRQQFKKAEDPAVNEIAIGYIDKTLVPQAMGDLGARLQFVFGGRADRIAAQYDRASDTIRLSRKQIELDFANKQWSRPRKPGATGLPTDAFKSKDEYEKFLIEHEAQHKMIGNPAHDPKIEDEVNRNALEVLSGKRSPGPRPEKIEYVDEIITGDPSRQGGWREFHSAANKILNVNERVATKAGALGVSRELERKLLRLIDKEPPELRYYHRRLIEELKANPAGDFDKLAPIHRWHLESKNPDIPMSAYVRWLKDQPEEKLRESLSVMAQKIAKRDPSEAAELAVKRHLADIDEQIVRFKTTPAENFGGAEGRDRVLGGLENLRGQAVEALKTKHDSNKFVAAWDWYNNSWKQSVLFAPPFSYVVKNTIDNIAKNVVTFGPRAVGQVNRYDIFGKDLGEHFFTPFVQQKFTVTGRESGHLVTGVREGSGFLDSWKPIRDLKARHLDGVLNNVESTTRAVAGSLAYHDKVAELRKLASPLNDQEVHRIALEHGKRMVDKVQFYGTEAPEAIKMMDRAFPFIRFNLYNTAFWLEQAWENPRASVLLLKARDKFHEASVDGDGSLKFDTTDIRLKPESWLSVTDLIKNVERETRGIDDPEKQTAYQFAAALTAAAGNMTLSGPYADFASTIFDGRTLDLLRGEGEEFENQKLLREGLFKLRQLFPLNLIDKPLSLVTGKHLDQYAVQKGLTGEAGHASFDRWENKGRNLQRTAALQRGEDISDKEALRRHYQAEWFRSVGFLLGVDAHLDRDNMSEKIRDVKRFYDRIPDEASRAAFYYSFTRSDGEPLLKGVAPFPDTVPEQHPDNDWLQKLRRMKPEDAIEELRDAPDDSKRAAAENLRGVFGDLSGKPGALARIVEAAMPSAAAEGGLIQRDSVRVKDGAKISEEMLRLYPDVRPPAGMERSFSVVPLNVGRPIDDRSIAWFPEATFLNKDVGEAALRQNRHMSTAFRHLRREYDARAAIGDENGLERLRTEPIHVEGTGKSAIYFDPKWFFESAKDGANNRIYDTMKIASEQGFIPMRGGKSNQPIYLEGSGSGFKGFAEELEWFKNGRLPQSVRIAREQRQKIQDQELGAWVSQMRQAISGNPNARSASAVHNEVLAAEKTGAAPKDFFNRLRDSAIDDRYDLLASFAIAEKGDRLPIYRALAYSSRDKDGSVSLNSSMVSRLILWDGLDELQILALTDKRLKEDLASRGPQYLADEREVKSSALESFYRENGWTVKAGEYESSRGLVDWKEDNFDGGVAADAIKPGVKPMGPLDRLVPDVLTGQQISPIPYRSDYPISGMVSFQKIEEESSRLSIDLVPELARPFRSVTEFITSSINRTRSANETAAMMEAAENQSRKEAGRPPVKPYVRTNFMEMAVNDIANMNPAQAAHGAYGIMQLSHAVGLIGRDEMDTLGRGINQAALMGAGTDVFTNVLELGSAVLGMQSLSQRYASLSQPTIQQAIGTNADGSTLYATRPNPNFNPGMASFGKHAATAGSLFTIGSGIAAAEGEKDLSIGMGVAGGALQGASLGMAFGVPGAAIGAVIGGALGGFLGSRGGNGDAKFNDNMALRNDMIRQQIAFNEERQREFHVDVSLRRGEATRRALAAAYDVASQARNQPRESPSGQRLREFLRRPTFSSSQGLVSVVERATSQTLKPRY